MRNMVEVFSILAFLSSMAWPCVSPGNIEGVAFTSGEELNLQKLTQFGTENVNYLKDGEEPNIGIRYISHYDPRAMVFIGTYGLSYQQNVRLNCMGVILPGVDSTNPAVRIPVSDFDFAAAVKTEIVWLSYIGVIGISNEAIEKIDSALRASDNGGVQYWTHAESVLGYNSWYTNDTLSGVWGSTLSAVRSANSVKGCSVIQPGSGLPPISLETTALASKIPAIQPGIHPVMARNQGNGAVIISFPRKTRANAILIALDLKGVLLLKQRIPTGISSLYLQKPVEGQYAVYYYSDR
jgi:hypothetical protein